MQSVFTRQRRRQTATVSLEYAERQRASGPQSASATQA
jgi:hypothetical protein